MPVSADLDPIRAAHGRPYAVELTGDADPASVIMAYADADPIVLWGSWLASELIIAVDPLVEIAGLDADDCWEPLAVRPTMMAPVSGVGGGWFAVLGYDPGTSWLAFCDAVLRRRADGSWVFETLGLSGRESATAAALERARRALAYDVDVPAATGPGIGPLALAADPPVADPPVADPPGADLGSVAADHLAGVERVIGRIRAGEVYQLNLCTRLTAPLLESPPELFVRTVSAVRPRYGAHLPTGPGTTLVSLSPERFLTLADGVVTTSPIKGTTKRSEDPDGSRLRSSAKDAAENVMITDLMRNDLSRVCEPGSVTVTKLLEVQAHPGVWHLVSTVSGRLAGGLGAADLLAATFPPGSVTGAPKSSAVRAIAAEEPQPRRAYTGAAGLVAVDGRAELSVLIRTFEVAHNADSDIDIRTAGTVELGVGGGITVDSVPVLEWRECLHKAEPLAVAAGSRLVEGLDDSAAPVPAALAAQGVFESILAQHGRPLRLADHLARLARSVRELYGADLPPDVGARALAAAAAPSPRAALRVHAAPASHGLAITITVRPLGPRLTSCSLALATRPEISWRHKWADRTELQAAEEAVAPALPYFLDPSGRLAETSRGNLFVLGRDGVWRTPPATDAILPGVTRRAILDTLGDRGIPHEITPVATEDLHSARTVIWTSSLSGAVAVAAIDGSTLADDDSGLTWPSWLGIA